MIPKHPIKLRVRLSGDGVSLPDLQSCRLFRDRIQSYASRLYRSMNRIKDRNVRLDDSHVLVSIVVSTFDERVGEYVDTEIPVPVEVKT